MQYLKISDKTTLLDLTDTVGERDVDTLLSLNGLTRSPNVGKQFEDKCKTVISQAAQTVPVQIKQGILNSFAGEGDIYEHACMLSEDGWKILAALGTFPNMLRIPESILLPDSVEILGGSSIGISPVIYDRSMASLYETGEIDTDIFNDYTAVAPAAVKSTITSKPSTSLQLFNLPWGKISLYSSLAQDFVDFPVYPEEYADDRSANYTTMPDMIYQYEPWQIYTGSGPVDKEFTFHFHRDMWTGDHRDGEANRLVRFCQSCCYPEYNGSLVDSGFVTLYLNGSPAITGVMTSCKAAWSGPLGLDGFYLECKLSIKITEVSETALSSSVVRGMSLVGD